MCQKFEISKEKLYDLYIVQNLNIYEVANMFNVTTSMIYKYIKKYEIKKSPEKIKERIKNTNLKKYGCENPRQNDLIKDKIKRTNLEKYGCEYSLQSEKIKEKRKQTNLEKYGCEYISQAQEIKDKIKQTNLEKYGCTCSLQSNDIKNKIKQTNLEKYGCEYPSQSEEFKEKVKKSNLEKYGCEYSFQSDGIKEKIKQTNLEKYGYEYATQSKEIQKKIRQTNLEKYGCEYSFQSEKIKEKRKQTNLEKYGCEYSLQSEKIKERIKNTNLKKYGCEYPSQAKIIKEKVKKSNLAKYGCEYPSQSEEFKEKYYPNISKYMSSKEDIENFINNNYFGKTTVLQFAKDINVSYTTCLNYIYKYNLEKYFDFNSLVSHEENDIIEYLKLKGISNIIQSERTILDGKEIDIYLPDYKIGIEFNGDYWHSELKKDKYYHYNKSILAASKGIFLYHIYSHEWFYEKKRIRILNHLNNILHLNENKIYARKCIIKEVSAQDKNIFLEENHIQGKDNSSIKLGLYCNDELVSLMTFCKSRFNKKYNWELSRFCSKHGYNVIGGSSKLFKYFVNNYMNNNEVIVSYSDIAKTQGKIYQTLNFKFIEDSDPNYIWWKSDFDYKTRYQCQMKNEKEIMSSQGYARVYDCGNKVWIYTK